MCVCMCVCMCACAFVHAHVYGVLQVKSAMVAVATDRQPLVRTTAVYAALVTTSLPSRHVNRVLNLTSCLKYCSLTVERVWLGSSETQPSAQQQYSSTCNSPIPMIRNKGRWPAGMRQTDKVIHLQQPNPNDQKQGTLAGRHEADRQGDSPATAQSQ